MGFLSLIVALLIEQVQPLRSGNVAYQAVRATARALERSFNAGERAQGTLAWLIMVVPLTAGTWAVFHVLVGIHPFLGLGWNVLILYLTLGFRQFSHYYTDIHVALANNDLGEARRLLTEWKSRATPQFSAAELSVSDVARLTIEEALLASHRHVFGVFFWFVVMPGPSGAVLYRLAEFLARHWNPPEPHDEPFGRFPDQAFWLIDWVPVRLTAIGFAIVGNFQDAVFAWQNHAAQWTERSRGIILASGGGALGVRLGDAHSLSAVGADGEGPAESMLGVGASPAAMHSAVGLVWRSLLLWLILLFLLSVAGLVG